VQVAVAGFPWGAYLGEDGKANGVDVCVSSWRRVAPDTIPAAAKAGGNYLSGVLISSEAKQRGFAEGIGLDANGLVSEGAGENLFVVRKGKIYTPPAGASILMGITRDTVITLARAEGIDVVEQAMPREALYLADEIFFTGTAAEITPVRSVDLKPVRANGRGEVTSLLQARFFGLFTGETTDRWNWLHPIRADERQKRHAAG
jgi:branched-chain amino acid aminotransferase